MSTSPLLSIFMRAPGTSVEASISSSMSTSVVNLPGVKENYQTTNSRLVANVVTKLDIPLLVAKINSSGCGSDSIKRHHYPSKEIYSPSMVQSSQFEITTLIAYSKVIQVSLSGQTSAVSFFNKLQLSGWTTSSGCIVLDEFSTFLTIGWNTGQNIIQSIPYKYNNMIVVDFSFNHRNYTLSDVLGDSDGLYGQFTDPRFKHNFIRHIDKDKVEQLRQNYWDNDTGLTKPKNFNTKTSTSKDKDILIPHYEVYEVLKDTYIFEQQNKFPLFVASQNKPMQQRLLSSEDMYKQPDVSGFIIGSVSGVSHDTGFTYPCVLGNVNKFSQEKLITHLNIFPSCITWTNQTPNNFTSSSNFYSGISAGHAQIISSSPIPTNVMQSIMGFNVPSGRTVISRPPVDENPFPELNQEERREPNQDGQGRRNRGGRGRGRDQQGRDQERQGQGQGDRQNERRGRDPQAPAGRDVQDRGGQPPRTGLRDNPGGDDAPPDVAGGRNAQGEGRE